MTFPTNFKQFYKLSTVCVFNKCNILSQESNETDILFISLPICPLEKQQFVKYFFDFDVCINFQDFL